MKKNTTKPVNDKFTEIISETDSQYKLTAIESKVKQAAAAVEKAESAETLAKDDLDCIERDLAKMKADQQQANECYRKAGKAKAAAYWRLGDAIRVLETALESRKGKHHSITPRKRAIELAGGTTRYQTAKDVREYFESVEDAEQYNHPLQTVINEFKDKRKKQRDTAGKNPPGRKPNKVKAVARAKPHEPENKGDSVRDEGLPDSGREQNPADANRTLKQKWAIAINDIANAVVCSELKNAVANLISQYGDEKVLIAVAKAIFDHCPAEK